MVESGKLASGLQVLRLSKELHIQAWGGNLVFCPQGVNKSHVIRSESKVANVVEK